jgi:hypothetical protein
MKPTGCERRIRRTVQREDALQLCLLRVSVFPARAMSLSDQLYRAAWSLLAILCTTISECQKAESRALVLMDERFR